MCVFEGTFFNGGCRVVVALCPGIIVTSPSGREQFNHGVWGGGGFSAAISVRTSFSIGEKNTTKNKNKTKTPPLLPSVFSLPEALLSVQGPLTTLSYFSPQCLDNECVRVYVPN